MKHKINGKLLLSLGTCLTLGVGLSVGIAFGLSAKNKDLTLNNQSNKSIVSANVGSKVGKIRNWHNTNFSGIEVTNGGFIALTGTSSITRVDTFGNILWEFDPEALSKSDPITYSNFVGKKVVEAVEDESNSNIFYLLLIPNAAADELSDIDKTDTIYYDNMVGANNVSNQATIVQITESVNSSLIGDTPSFVINNSISIDPEQMVMNYPSSWNSTQTTNTFFSNQDHPSWYISNNSQSISNPGNKMVMPWKQYVTNLGNMYARNGVVFIFGGNGSVYNDPEALSIGMWRLNFSTNQYSGIPYAYVLAGMKYFGEISNTDPYKWCYAPIGQTDDFNYVPRLAVGGVQKSTNSNGDTFLYLAGGITVGQIANSQTRDAGIKNQSSTVVSLQDKRSLQLTGQNIVSSPQKPDRNSIDPCLLFGTALNIDTLEVVQVSSTTKISNVNNILYNNSYFDIGGTVGTSSSIGTYYFFNDMRNHEVFAGYEDPKDVPLLDEKVPIYKTEAQKISHNEGQRRSFSYNLKPVFNFGSVEYITENTCNSDGTVNDAVRLGTSKASYSYNLTLLAENAQNYYYPTLSYGYSLKSVSSLTKVKSTTSKGTLNGYAMQVGKSILYLNEPKFDDLSIISHGPSTVSIGDSNLVGKAYYSSSEYIYKYNAWDNQMDYTYRAFSSSGNYLNDNRLLSMGVGEYIAGIKEFNDTVPTIASSFKIANDPYGSTTNMYTRDATLSWNTFTGLTSIQGGAFVSSSWFNPTNNNTQFLVTGSPLITETDPNALTQNWTFNEGTKKAWFENCDSSVTTNNNTTQTLQIVPQYRNVDSSLQSINNYFLNTTSTIAKIAIPMRTKFDSSESNYLFGQTSSGSGLSYCEMGSVYNIPNQYNIVDINNRDTILGQGNFLDTLSKDFVTKKINNYLEAVPLSTVTNNPSDTTTVKIINSENLSNFFKVIKLPKVNSNTQLKYGSVIIMAQEGTQNNWILTPYSWNEISSRYEIMPKDSSNTLNIWDSSIAGSTVVPPSNPATPVAQELDGWVVPVASTVPSLIFVGVCVTIILFAFSHKKTENMKKKLLKKFVVQQQPVSNNSLNIQAKKQLPHNFVSKNNIKHFPKAKAPVRRTINTNAPIRNFSVA
ncbi:hypothetical protein [Mycoplasmoides alvi]|uniref:hypothetical protein n=1 Tax=Mycoplasmoides alvi TaxID=78580 RepID=UPI00051C07AC|nr:hypothetical protein [Mycoplasmoides alvi]